MKHDGTSAQVDTFLNEQGTGVPTDTQGYGGLEHPDTSGQQQQPGTTGLDSSGMPPDSAGR
jgi:hypothetical protein